MEDLVIIAVSLIGIAGWAILESWDYLREIWNTHIISDYDGEGDI